MFKPNQYFDLKNHKIDCDRIFMAKMGTKKERINKENVRDLMGSLE